MGDWSDEDKLTCQGIGPIESESIMTCGLHGGGLPHGNKHGESIEIVAPQWPQSDQYFCRNYSSLNSESDTSDCCKIDTEFLRSYGFSWCGNYLVSATGSDLKLWKRL